ncbi:MAG: hypothetical protein H6668_20085, partial [Ardenticatenaceae bacterium]|nr:hypothetical protein [Ardenticatenaceae bacterium]
MKEYRLGWLCLLAILLLAGCERPDPQVTVIAATLVGTPPPPPPPGPPGMFVNGGTPPP